MSMIYTLKQEFKHIESKEVEEKFKNIKYDEFLEILELLRIKDSFFRNLENKEKCIKFVFEENDFIELSVYSIRLWEKTTHSFNIFYNIEATGETIKLFSDEEIKIMKEYKPNNI